MIGRRAFFKYSGGTMLALYAVGRNGVPVALGEVLEGGSLDPTAIPKFISQLLIPPVMPRAGAVRSGRTKVDYYEIALRQFDQQVLPAPLPRTTVWGYGAVSADRKGRRLVNLFHAPSLTIHARAGTPVRVKWINQLVDRDGSYLPHLLPVDPTLHWANPERLGSHHTDSRPVLDGRSYVATTSAADVIDARRHYTRYWGPVPMVTHVHGAVGVGDESDGYPEAWFLPAARDLPAGSAHHGTWYDFFAGKAARRFGVHWGPGYSVAQYPNDNRPSTLWYHDHSLGMTRLNVYTGPAGFFLVRGGRGGDKDVIDRRNNTRAVLPGPAPKYGSVDTTHCRDIPIAIQDRSFNDDGSLFYPDSRTFFDDNSGPYIPRSETPPIWNPEFFGNTIVVNGQAWPYHRVERRRYRFRVLNGCQSRFLILDFGGIPGISVWQIGNEGGLLRAPVNLSSDHGSRLLLGPAERADLIVDFTAVPEGSYTLRNVGADEPFGGGVPGQDFEPADPATTGSVMQFQVVARRGDDATTPPRFLRLPSVPTYPTETVTRRLALLEHGHDEEGPTAAVLGTVRQDASAGSPQWDGTGVGHATAQKWSDEPTTNPAAGATEVWEIYNLTVDAHPIHIHEVTFEVLNRQRIHVDDLEVALTGEPPSPPNPWEDGRKDTVVAPPGHVTRIRTTFTRAGRYVWHCHILEHEDNEMMLPLQVGPRQVGEPEGR